MACSVSSSSSFFLKNLFILLIYFWLRWVFVAARRFSLVGESGATLRCGERASHCCGFSHCGARALGVRASIVAAHGLRSCGTWAQLLSGLWDLPGPGLEPMSPALAGGFSTTAPPGKPDSSFLTGLWASLVFSIYLPCLYSCQNDLSKCKLILFRSS